MEHAEAVALARVIRSECRAIERRLGNVKRLAARLAEELDPTDTSQEDTDVEDRSPAHALHA